MCVCACVRKREREKNRGGEEKREAHVALSCAVPRTTPSYTLSGEGKIGVYVEGMDA